LTSSSSTYLFKTHLREPETKLMRILYTIHKNESREREREREREILLLVVISVHEIHLRKRLW
jgi:hypothetical protein